MTSPARTALSPEDSQLAALEISHPDLAAPARVINDHQSRVIEGETYQKLAFRARIAGDADGRVPTAELVMDNVGREILQWIDQAQATASGIHGISVRVMIVTARGAEVITAPDYDVTMDVVGLTADTKEVVATLGFDPFQGRAAVTLRHDPTTSPGVF